MSHPCRPLAKIAARWLPAETPLGADLRTGLSWRLCLKKRKEPLVGRGCWGVWKLREVVEELEFAEDCRNAPLSHIPVSVLYCVRWTVSSSGRHLAAVDVRVAHQRLPVHVFRNPCQTFVVILTMLLILLLKSARVTVFILPSRKPNANWSLDRFSQSSINGCRNNYINFLIVGNPNRPYSQ